MGVPQNSKTRTTIRPTVLVRVLQWNRTDRMTI